MRPSRGSVPTVLLARRLVFNEDKHRDHVEEGVALATVNVVVVTAVGVVRTVGAVWVRCTRWVQCRCE